MSYNDLFIGTVLGFLASSLRVVTATIPDVPAATEHQTGFVERTQRGIHIMLRERPLRDVLWLNLAVASPMAIVMVNTVVLVRGGLGLFDADLAWALAILGLGSILVVFVLPKLLEQVSELQLMLPGAVLGVPLLAATVILEPSYSLIAVI